MSVKHFLKDFVNCDYQLFHDDNLVLVRPRVVFWWRNDDKEVFKELEIPLWEKGELHYIYNENTQNLECVKLDYDEDNAEYDNISLSVRDIDNVSKFLLGYVPQKCQKTSYIWFPYYEVKIVTFKAKEFLEWRNKVGTCKDLQEILIRNKYKFPQIENEKEKDNKTNPVITNKEIVLFLKETHKELIEQATVSIQNRKHESKKRKREEMETQEKLPQWMNELYQLFDNANIEYKEFRFFQNNSSDCALWDSREIKNEFPDFLIPHLPKVYFVTMNFKFTKSKSLETPDPDPDDRIESIKIKMQDWADLKTQEISFKEEKRKEMNELVDFFQVEACGDYRSSDGDRLTMTWTSNETIEVSALLTCDYNAFISWLQTQRDNLTSIGMPLFMINKMCC